MECREDLISRLVATNPAEQEVREELYYQVRAIDALVQMFEMRVDDAEVAQANLTEMGE